ncbi:Hpt domain-containing protein [Acinetobacter sp. WZC-1]|uniref:Hpt domain-containing protein n=1 Tax=Acinetobacter sp. WZC-1 TaxID=3459034 RepID=UPI00403D9152
MKEILKHLVETIVLPDDSYMDQEDEILGIFTEELDEIFEDLQPQLEQWLQHPVQENDYNLTDIRRYFHTLKGSGRMVGARRSAELAWMVEDILNRVIENHLSVTQPLQQYVLTVSRMYQYKLLPDFKNRHAHQQDLRPLVLLGQHIQQNQELEPVLADLLTLATALEQPADVTGLEIQAEIADAEPVEMVTETAAETMAERHPVQVDQSAESDQLLSETLAIFTEESEEHLSVIEEFLQQEQHSSDQYNRLIRALHTLRGSSSMAHVAEIFEASTRVEHLFRMLVQEDTESSINENVLLTHYAEFVRNYLFTLKASGLSAHRQLQEIGQRFNDAWACYGFQLQQPVEHSELQHPVSQLLNLQIETLLDTGPEFERRARAEFPDYLRQLSQQAQQLSEHTENRAAQGIHDFSIALKQGYDVLMEKPELLNTVPIFHLFSQAHQQLIYLFDTLASGQRVSLDAASTAILQELHDGLQSDGFYKNNIQNNDLNQSDSQQDDVQPGQADSEAVVESLPVPADLTEPEMAIESTTGIGRIVEQINADKQDMDCNESLRDFDVDVLEIFIEEAEELLVGMDQDLNDWSSDLQNPRALNNLMRHLHTLKGGANMAQAVHIGQIAHELESIYERLIKHQMQPTEQLVHSIRLIQDDLADRIQLIRAQGIDYPAVHILQGLRQIGQQSAGEQLVHEQVTPVTDITPVDHPETVAVLDDADRDAEHQASEAEASTEQVATENLAASTNQSAADQVEAITRATYAEEAEQLLAEAAILLKQWFDQRNNRSLLLKLQRIAHSLKGGARMIRLEPASEIAYALENAFEQFAVHNFSLSTYDTLLETAFSWLRGAILNQDVQHFDGLKHRLNQIEYIDVSAGHSAGLTRPELWSDQQAAAFVQGDGSEPPSMLGEWDQMLHTEQNNEMIRISADLIEKMIDLSGENAINRSRIEMDLSQLGNTLSDMELAIQRLADQLRRMEGELESQIMAKHGDLSARYTDFDPLEMDQYSSLNQLSKSLAESASDLVDFRSTLAEKIRDTEGLLLQQSRVQAEIQDSLMRTRLVPFSGLLPRLQRVVRQTSTALSRPTELMVNNTEGELDRTILEKLISPLEHMLRNAIDHGIEETAARLKANKPATGRIDLNISRQGTDVVVTFQDDGQGIDAAQIRAKALDAGLIQKNQQLEQEEILQLIFHPGFSTAKQVTHISGRGVGLDVVQSEIKSLGGQVTVESDVGMGSTFTIRVPTTVAVSDALMVRVGDQQFAVPLSHIDRIVRISPAALEEFFNSREEYFEIDHQSHKLRYLAEFTAHQPLPRLQGIAHSLPVLLIKGSMGQATALLVDQLIGSRSQIVMKPIGQQFAGIGIIAGATILGDGQVCLILDGQHIARQVQLNLRVQDAGEQRDLQRQNDQRRLVMIVDDSVTVRKVTSRLLERNGFDVVTAKDGVDAMEQLENIQPDLMLLDIEMPRMDGFEVINLVRHHNLHLQLPIIMITSRTGEKHRERAFNLGATDYMGKPFQEAELLEHIQALLEPTGE